MTDKMIKYTTSLISYYVVKCILLYNSENINTYIETNLKIKKITKLDDFIKLCKTMTDDDLLMKNIQNIHFDNTLAYPLQGTIQKKFINETLRMTCTDI